MRWLAPLGMVRCPWFLAALVAGATGSSSAALAMDSARPATGDAAGCDMAGKPMVDGLPLDGFAADLSGEIGSRWNLGAASEGALASVVVLRVCLAEDGSLLGVALYEGDGPSPEAVNELYEGARRAVMRAYADGGFSLPPDKYEIWHVMDLVFDARAMRLR